MKIASPKSPVAHRRRRSNGSFAIQAELFFDEESDASNEMPEQGKLVRRAQIDPLRHAQYLARQMKRHPVDAETRRATVRALCADLVQSLKG